MSILFKFGHMINVTKNSVKDVVYQQTRNTFVLKRRHPPRLTKKGLGPKRMTHKFFIYDLVQDTNILPQQEVSVILKDYVEGYGEAGEVIKVKCNNAYEQFLLPGLAVYDIPENEKYKNIYSKDFKPKYSSLGAKRVMDYLTSFILDIGMNYSTPWVLEPWHVKVAFRKRFLEVPDHAIELPPWEIKGPNKSLEKKEFYITVTINNTEKVNVRCRIFHWHPTTDPNISLVEPWNTKLEPLFPEQADILNSMPLKSPDAS